MKQPGVTGFGNHKLSWLPKIQIWVRQPTGCVNFQPSRLKPGKLDKMRKIAFCVDRNQIKNLIQNKSFL